MEQLIDMLALLKEVSRISLIANFSRKLEGNNGAKFRCELSGRANYRTKIRGEVPRAANFRSKIRGVETIGVAKMRRNIAENSFRANFRRKAPKSQEIRRNSFALLLHNTVTNLQISPRSACCPNFTQRSDPILST